MSVKGVIISQQNNDRFKKISFGKNTESEKVYYQNKKKHNEKW